MHTECTPELKNILEYHQVAQEIVSQDLQAQQAIDSKMADNQLFVTKTQSEVRINGTTKVTVGDIEAINGRLEVLDQVLMPDSIGSVTDAVAKRYDFSKINAAIQESGIKQELDIAQDLTLFAPTNEAIAKLTTQPLMAEWSKLLRIHALGQRLVSASFADAGGRFETLGASTLVVTKVGEDWTVKSDRTDVDSKLSATEIIARNGVVHTIDSVLMLAKDIKKQQTSL